MILLINPPVYDFSAYDLWAKPLGLLYIGAVLKSSGCKINLIDYLDRRHPKQPSPKSRQWGCGHYYAVKIQKPEALRNIPRYYKRFGLPREIVVGALKTAGKPRAVLVTSGMTYWYPGVFEAISTVKEVYPGVPVILGGIYATLSFEHAKERSGADYVVKGSNFKELAGILRTCGVNLAEENIPEKFSDYPRPAYELYGSLEYAPVRTSNGCPFDCTYCASKLLSGGRWEKKSPEKAASEIKWLLDKGINNLAFYDDALLAGAEEHIIPLLEILQNNGIKTNFHSPNGLHARFISQKLAGLLKKAEFIMPRLSLETADPARQKTTGLKVTNDDFLNACNNLLEAGYQKGGYGAYIMAGMSGQSMPEAEESMYFAHKAGAKIQLAEYSPIPGTVDWEHMREILPSRDPLFHNNSVFPAYNPEFKKLQKLKDLSKRLNKDLTCR